MQMRDRDSGNRELDVVGIRDPGKAVDKWKRQMLYNALNVLRMMYIETYKF